MLVTSRHPHARHVACCGSRHLARGSVEMAARGSLLLQLLLLGLAGALPPLPWQPAAPPTPPANEWDRNAKGAAQALAADLLAQALADNTVVIFSRQVRVRFAGGERGPNARALPPLPSPRCPLFATGMRRL